MRIEAGAGYESLAETRARRARNAWIRAKMHVARKAGDAAEYERLFSKLVFSATNLLSG